MPLSVILVVPMCLLCALAGIIAASMDLNIFVQVGFVVLVGLACKNAILIVEFAKAEFERSGNLVAAALHGARIRLRPILMTSFAFILGCVPLWFAAGAGAVSRRILGTVVVTGMLTATLLAIFLIPVLYVLVERMAGSERKLEQRLVGVSPIAEEVHP